MNKSRIPLLTLAEHYLTTCRTEGKTSPTIRGYTEKLGRFVRWSDGATFGDFSIYLARDYISYLQNVPKWEGHPFNKPNGDKMSAANVRNHVRVLRSFSSWLHREGFSQENVLAPLKVPRAATKVVQTLSDDEIARLFSCLDPDTAGGCRNAAMLLLFLDTGLRLSELLRLSSDDIHLEERWLRVMGKGQKERIVPFGAQAAKLMQRHMLYFRPESQWDDVVFLTAAGSPISENAIRLILHRLARNAGIRRLHVHLLRHTFATRYLLNGGDAFSLQRILGHTTLEMTRRYVDMVAMERVVMMKQPTAMDRFITHMRGMPKSARP